MERGRGRGGGRQSSHGGGGGGRGGFHHKTAICKFWQQGYCRNGDACSFAHGPGELQSQGGNISGGRRGGSNAANRGGAHSNNDKLPAGEAAFQRQMVQIAERAFQRQSTLLKESVPVGNVLLMCSDAEVIDEVREYALQNSLTLTISATVDDTCTELSAAERALNVVVLHRQSQAQTLLALIKEHHPAAFCVVWHDVWSCGREILRPLTARERLDLFEEGAHMIANDNQSLSEVFSRVKAHISDLSSDGQAFDCPWCDVPPMSLASLASHLPMYHGARNASDMGPDYCTVPGCRRRHPRPDDEVTPRIEFWQAWQAGSFNVHVHYSHLCGSESGRARGSLTGFAHVVCRRPQDGRFLLVHEPADLCESPVTRFWWPAGRVDPGEGFVQCAMRETEEEGGVRIRVVGVLYIHLSSSAHRLDVALLAEPEPREGQDAPVSCKSVPDFESVGAMWVEVRDLMRLEPKHFRNTEPLQIFPLVDSGKMVCHSIETPAFRQLEQVMKTWTTRRGCGSDFVRRGPDDVLRDVASVWQALKDEYKGSRVLVEG
jgi:8-oxo-dGTP pyrophosphatase MutT (NUDIX family)